MQSLAVNRGVELTAAIDPNVPHIKADPIRLRQILYNLISNAVKFTNRNGRVRVSAEADSRGVAIKVADTGSVFPVARVLLMTIGNAIAAMLAFL